jgi:hypothetical protein
MIIKITRNGINGAMFVTISTFLVIDDNTIKASIKFIKIDKLNHLHLLGRLPSSIDGLASPYLLLFSHMLT